MGSISSLMAFHGGHLFQEIPRRPGATDHCQSPTCRESMRGPDHFTVSQDFRSLWKRTTWFFPRAHLPTKQARSTWQLHVAGYSGSTKCIKGSYGKGTQYKTKCGWFFWLKRKHQSVYRLLIVSSKVRVAAPSYRELLQERKRPQKRSRRRSSKAGICQTKRSVDQHRACLDAKKRPIISKAVPKVF